MSLAEYNALQETLHSKKQEHLYLSDKIFQEIGAEELQEKTACFTWQRMMYFTLQNVDVIIYFQINGFSFQPFTLFKNELLGVIYKLRIFKPY